jgi:hypothetical protein
MITRIQSSYDRKKIFKRLSVDFVKDRFGVRHHIELPEPKPIKVLFSIEDCFNSGLFTQIVPIELVNEALQEQDKESQRNRLLPSPTIVYLVMAMNIWRNKSQEQVLRDVCQGLKILDPNFAFENFPSRAAISQARSRIGDGVMEELAGKILKPIALPETIGARYKGFRLMAIDGTTFSVLNYTLLGEHFGYPSAKQGEPGFPQARVVALVELGTRVIVDAEIDAYNISELELTRGLLKKNPLNEEMLLLADRLFYSYRLWQECSDTGAALLWRVKNNLIKPVIERLPDGSYITEVKDSKDRTKPPMKVRVVEYHMSGEGLTSEQKGKKVSIYTNLFDHNKYPAHELAALYHERWGIETVFKELENRSHLRIAALQQNS